MALKSSTTLKGEAIKAPWGKENFKEKVLRKVFLLIIFTHTGS